MAIPQETVDRLLVECNRTCALCRKWLVPVEIHHIVPQGKGGGDEQDNLIVLCRNCHSVVGSYNESHPAGRKFSSSELRARKQQLVDDLKRQRSRVNCSCASGSSRMQVEAVEPTGSCVLRCPICGAEVQVKVSDKSVDAQIYMSRGIDWGQVAEFVARLASLGKPTTVNAVQAIELEGLVSGNFTNDKTGMTFARGQGQLDSLSLRVDGKTLEQIRGLLDQLAMVADTSKLGEAAVEEITAVAAAVRNDDTHPDAVPILVLRVLSLVQDQAEFSAIADRLKLAIVDFDSCEVSLRPWHSAFGMFGRRGRRGDPA